MDGAEGSLWGGLSGTPLRWVGSSAVSVVRPAGQGPGTVLVAMVPLIYENSLHPCSMRLATLLPRSQAGFLGYGATKPPELPGTGCSGLLPAAERSSTKPRPSVPCVATAFHFMGAPAHPIPSSPPPGTGCSIPWDRRHVSTG